MITTLASRSLSLLLVLAFALEVLSAEFAAPLQSVAFADLVAVGCCWLFAIALSLSKAGRCASSPSTCDDDDDDDLLLLLLASPLAPVAGVACAATALSLTK